MKHLFARRHPGKSRRGIVGEEQPTAGVLHRDAVGNAAEYRGQFVARVAQLGLCVEPSQRAGKDTGDRLQETGVVTREAFVPAGKCGDRAEWIVGRADAHVQTGASAVLDQQPIRNEATLGGEVVDDDHAARRHREICLSALVRRHCDVAQDIHAKANSGGEAHRVRVRREFHDADELGPKDAHDDGAGFGE